MGGTHIHHLVWGILLVLDLRAVGAVERPGEPWQHIAVVGFGIGTGLTMDECPRWLNLRDVYWEKEGRRSIDAVIVVAILAGLAVTGLRLWVDAAKDVETEAVTVVGAIGSSASSAPWSTRPRRSSEWRSSASRSRLRGWSARSGRSPDVAVGPCLLLAGEARAGPRAVQQGLSRRLRWACYAAPTDEPPAPQPGAFPPPLSGSKSPAAC